MPFSRTHKYRPWTCVINKLIWGRKWQEQRVKQKTGKFVRFSLKKFIRAFRSIYTQTRIHSTHNIRNIRSWWDIIQIKRIRVQLLFNSHFPYHDVLSYTLPASHIIITFISLCWAYTTFLILFWWFALKFVLEDRPLLKWKEIAWFCPLIYPGCKDPRKCERKIPVEKVCVYAYNTTYPLFMCKRIRPVTQSKLQFFIYFSCSMLHTIGMVDFWCTWLL